MRTATFLDRLLGAGTPSPPDDPEAAARLLRFHHLEGLALARHREGEPFLPRDLVAAFEPAYRAASLSTTLVVESAQRAQEVLGAAGIPVVVFKGAALVMDGLYRDPGARGMDDADLVVPATGAADAVDALIRAGFRPVVPWSPSMVGWSDALALHDLESPGGIVTSLDLHWRTAYDRLRFGAGGDSILLRGRRPGHTPAHEAHFVIVAEHLLKHIRYRIHMPAYADLVRLAGVVSDWERVEQLVAASRLERGLRAVMHMLASDLAAPVPDRVGAGFSPRLAKSLVPSRVAGRTGITPGRLSGIVHRWSLLGSPRLVARDLWEAAVPSGGWLRARYGSGGVGAWVRYVGDVVRWTAYRGRSPASPHQEIAPPGAHEKGVSPR